jgi:hypothetical protein
MRRRKPNEKARNLVTKVLGIREANGGKRVVRRQDAQPALPPHVPDGEPLPCMKVRYEAQQEAEQAAGKYRQHAYRCVLCGGWHATKGEAKRRPK